DTGADVGGGRNGPVSAVGVDVPVELRAEGRGAHAETPAAAPGGTGAVLHVLGVARLVRGGDAESHAEPCSDNRRRAERDDRDPLRAMHAALRAFSCLAASRPPDRHGRRRPPRPPGEVSPEALPPSRVNLWRPRGPPSPGPPLVPPRGIGVGVFGA